jgi:glycerate-2-kinase
MKEQKNELSNIEDVDKVILEILGETKEYCEQCDELIEEEHICYTCCGDEITGDVEDVGLCPTCLEHI